MMPDAPVVRDVILERIEPLASSGIVGMRRAVGHDRLRLRHPLEPVPDIRRNLHERVVVGAEEDLHQLATCLRALTIVEENELDPPANARIVQRHLAMPMPALDDATVNRREVDLAELV